MDETLAAALPASHRGAAPLLGKEAAATSTPALTSSPEIKEFEFHLSRAQGASRP
jgi:hypothetical protein